jgi:predicted SprT family Zn-dependent metalloprotease
MKNIKDFNQFLNETVSNQEYPDVVSRSEYIDFNTTDLYENFKFLNNLMFDNKLQPVPLKWFNTKRYLGLLKFKENNIENLLISTFYKMTKKQFLETLAHEMIHVYIFQNNIRDNGDHGSKFKHILNTLNQKHPEYEIKPTENTNYFSVNSTKKKLTGVLLFIADGNDYTAIYTNNDIVNDETIIDKFIDDLKKYIIRIPMNIFVREKSVEIKIYSCDSPELLHFKIKRQLSIKNLGFYDVSEKTLNEIKKGELITSYKLK